MPFYFQTVSPLLLDTLNKLVTFPELAGFRLVGGTALSLQLGHRESDDIDLFTDALYGTVDFVKLDNKIRENFNYVDATIPVMNQLGKPYFIGLSRDEFIKVDLFYTDPFCFPAVHAGNITIASPEDIIIMKLGMITGEPGGRKKDFWDLHELLSRFSLRSMVSLFRQNSYTKLTEQEILNKIEDFSWADHDFPPRCLRGKYWELVKLDVEEEVNCLILPEIHNQIL